MPTIAQTEDVVFEVTDEILEVAAGISPLGAGTVSYSQCSTVSGCSANRC